MVPLKYLNNFWRTLEMLLINCEFSLMLPWSANSCLVTSIAINQEPTFRITDTKLYIPVVILSTENISKLLEQSKSDFKRRINLNKSQSKNKKDF